MRIVSCGRTDRHIEAERLKCTHYNYYYMHCNHCHRATAHLHLNIGIIIIIIIIIIIHLGISFMQGIYTYIPEANHVLREHCVAAILVLLFIVLISLVPTLTPLYLYVSTFRSMCAEPNMAVFCSSLTSWFPDMLLTYFLNDFEMAPVVIIIIIIIIIIKSLCGFSVSGVMAIRKPSPGA